MNQLLICLLAIAPLAANAQTSHSLQAIRPKTAAGSSKVYTYVEQMPELPGGGGTGAIASAVMKRLRFPAIEVSCYRVAAYFEMNSSGLVQHPRITISSKSAVLDSALLAAVRSLLALRPGYQQGKPVTVSFTIPLNIHTQ